MSNNISRRKFLKTTAAAYGALLLPGSSISCSGSRELDIVILNGTIIDGTGREGFTADIGITGDAIAAIGDLRNSNAHTNIDAQGKIVAPGFIDIHSHTDSGLLRVPNAESKVRQGVTTDVGGNCGSSPFPRLKENYSKASSPEDCINFNSLRERFNSSQFSVNTSLFTGHGTIRNLVLGQEDRKPSANELRIMKDILKDALQQGSAGLSSGLEYTPGRYADKEELAGLCKVVVENGGVYATHMRSEDEKLVEAVEEALETARETGVSLQISHLKAAGKPNWHKIDRVIEMIDKAHSEGVNVHFDRYPYLAYSTGLSFFFPGWALEGGSSPFIERLKNRAARDRMKKDTMIKVEANGGWETIMISDIKNESNSGYLGRRIDEIAGGEKEDPFNFVCELLISEQGNISIVGYAMSEKNTEKVLSHPLCMIGSDGYATDAQSAMASGKPHPRSFGTFPKAIRDYSLNKKVVGLPDMIRKMTSLPADKLGISDRGRITEKAIADIVVFTQDEIRDRATYLEPWHYPEGIKHVLVNGKEVIKYGLQTDLKPGKYLSGS
ncbi:amidohydrolase family protein [candidate division KSB1 bacterium]